MSVVCFLYICFYSAFFLNMHKNEGSYYTQGIMDFVIISSIYM